MEVVLIVLNSFIAITIFVCMIMAVFSWRHVFDVSEKRLDMLEEHSHRIERVVVIVARIYEAVKDLPELKDQLSGMQDSMLGIETSISEQEKSNG